MFACAPLCQIKDPHGRGMLKHTCNEAHQIEKVGEKLRAMIPWISKGKLVNRARSRFSHTVGCKKRIVASALYFWRSRL